MTPTLSRDAAMVLGLAGTALPFARTRADEVERWLRDRRLALGIAGAGLAATVAGLLFWRDRTWPNLLLDGCDCIRVADFCGVPSERASTHQLRPAR